MLRRILGLTLTCFLMIDQPAANQSTDQVVEQVEEAIHLTPDIDNGREVYRVCAVCHMPEGWGTKDGYYPQIARQHATVIIKQLADILACNRDTPTMLPFTFLGNRQPQEFADVAAYLARQLMTRDNGLGPGTDLDHGKRLYEENCADCHGRNGEGIEKEYMP